MDCPCVHDVANPKGNQKHNYNYFLEYKYNDRWVVVPWYKKAIIENEMTRRVIRIFLRIT